MRTQINRLKTFQKSLKEYKDDLDVAFGKRKSKVTDGDDLAPGVLKIVKVYLAIKKGEFSQEIN